MKILQVHNRYQLQGGEDTVVKVERDILQKHGHDVSLFEVNNDNIRGIVSKLRVAFSTSYSASSKKLLAIKINNYQPDVIHVHNFFPQLTPSIYDSCREAGIPVVQTLHNYRTICPGALLMRNGNVCEDCVNGSAYHSVLHGCYRNSRIGSLIVARMVEMHRKRRTWQEKVDRFIVLTEFAKQKFVQAGFPNDKIVVKPNFSAIKAQTNFNALLENPYALFVGRLSKEKGIDTLLQAWNRLSLPLHLVGDGPLLYKAQSAKSDKIICCGHMSSEDVTTKMAQASFLIMPSEWYEGFPMVLVEAFSLGLPVIVSRLGGMAEIVEDGITGLHFEAGNPFDLEKKVKWMQSHPEECKEMGRNALQIYLDKYTPEINYKKLMQIYHEAIKEHV